jgi:endonuclease III
MNNKNLSSVMEILLKKYPSREMTTLNRLGKEEKKDAFKILISCLLSLRARDENTEIVTEKLFKRVSNPQEIVGLDLLELEKIIFSSGHYHKKALVLKSVSSDLINRFDSKVPDTQEELLSIKGIGPKTANIVLNFSFDKPYIPIDTHCHRIPNRIGWIETKNAEKTEKEIVKLLPKKYWKNFNSIFVQFGREICAPISPKCSICPIEKYCKKIGVQKSR